MNEAQIRKALHRRYVLLVLLDHNGPCTSAALFHMLHAYCHRNRKKIQFSMPSIRKDLSIFEERDWVRLLVVQDAPEDRIKKVTAAQITTDGRRQTRRTLLQFMASGQKEWKSG
jgi:hypothetical protein